MKKHPVIFIFIDGVGLGENNRDKNPFARFPNYFFNAFCGGEHRAPGFLVETDAHMGIPGLPQSATGQTALFTGYNGPQILGRHVNGFPTFTLRPYFKEKNILKIFNENGYNATLINSYSEKYLERLRHPRAERMLSASSLMQKFSGKPYFTTADYLAGKSLYMDLTNWFLRKHGLDIPMVNAKANGRKLAQIARDYDLLIFEYFFTDKVGHEQSMGAARKILRHVEDFLSGLWEELDADTQTVVVSSDHGNFEDLSVKTHTKNKVGTLVYGKYADIFNAELRFLYDIPRIMLKLKNLSFVEEFKPAA